MRRNSRRLGGDAANSTRGTVDLSDLPAPHGIELIWQHDAAGFAALRLILQEYARTLGVNLCFQNFDQEVAELPGDYAEPRGALVRALVNGELAACCALRPLDNADYPLACEMKRLFVRPQYRGLGLGRQLVEAVLDAARRAGYVSVLLDTLSDMEAARALYEDLGFEEIPPYYHNPIAGAHYLMARLR